MSCCEDRTKREVVEDRDGKRVERCTVCGKHHVRLRFDPMRLSKQEPPPERVNG